MSSLPSLGIKPRPSHVKGSDRNHSATQTGIIIPPNLQFCFISFTDNVYLFDSVSLYLILATIILIHNLLQVICLFITCCLYHSYLDILRSDG